MIWRKALLMLPFLLLLQIKGMNEQNLTLDDFGIEINLADHYNDVRDMMGSVQGRIGSILERLQNEYDQNNETSNNSKLEYKEASEAIEKYFKRSAKEGFEFLKNEATYTQISTILFVATDTEQPRHCEIHVNRWDLRKLFQLPPNVGILTSLKNDKWFSGRKRFLLRRNRGVEAFKVYYAESLPFDGYDPHDVNNGLETTLMLSDDQHKPTEEGDEFVYYDPVLANNNLEENHFYIVRGWFETFFSAGLMKQYLPVVAMGWSIGALKTIVAGQYFLFMLLIVGAWSFFDLKIILTNDQRKLIIPGRTDLWLVRQFVNTIGDLFKTSTGIAGAIAKFVVSINPLEHLREVRQNPKKFIGSVLISASIFGYVFLGGALAFYMAIENRHGGAFQTFNTECYDLQYHGYTEMECWEHLAGGAVTYWLPGMQEGWTYWELPTFIIGGWTWFATGMFYKVLKVLVIEPMLVNMSKLSSFLYIKAQSRAYNYLQNYEEGSCMRKLVKYDLSKVDNLQMHAQHNVFKTATNLVAVIILYPTTKVLYKLIGDTSGFWLWLSYALGVQGFYFIFNILPQKIAKYVGIVAFWISSILLFIICNYVLWNKPDTGLLAVDSGTLIANFATTFATIGGTALLVRAVIQSRKLLWYNPPDANKPLYWHMVKMATAVKETLFTENLTPKRPGYAFLAVGLPLFVTYCGMYLQTMMTGNLGEGELLY